MWAVQSLKSTNVHSSSAGIFVARGAGPYSMLGLRPVSARPAKRRRSHTFLVPRLLEYAPSLAC
jgi:hypothetical protein